MKKYITASAAILFLSACGSTTVIREVTATTEKLTVETYPPEPVQEAPKANKYDLYYQHLLDNSGQAQTSSKATLIELGDLTCGALERGNSVAAVVDVLNDASSGKSDTDLYASVLVGAVSYLCPEYARELKAYLTS